MVVGEASIHNIMGGMESTGGVRLHNHKRKLKQRYEEHYEYLVGSIRGRLAIESVGCRRPLGPVGDLLRLPERK